MARGKLPSGDAASARAEGVIREAVARALFDAPPDLLEGFTRQWGGKHEAVALAQRIAKELDAAGWQMKPGSGRDRRMTLEDEIVFAVDFATSKTVLAELGSDNRGKASWARGVLAGKIQESLHIGKVVLVKRRKA